MGKLCDHPHIMENAINSVALASKKLRKPNTRVSHAASGVPASDVSHLTPGEKEFLDQLANGYAYKEIAGRMNISIDTVRSYHVPGDDGTADGGTADGAHG